MKYEENIKVPKFVAENGFYTTETRSKNMSKIRAKDTKPELKLRKAIWAKGYRYRVHPKKIPGKPDIFFGKYKLAVFVDGEFWHGHDWQRRKQRLKANRDFWIAKIERNMQRDRQVNDKLATLGIDVMRYWEMEVKKETERVIAEIIKKIEENKK